MNDISKVENQILLSTDWIPFGLLIGFLLLLLINRKRFHSLWIQWKARVQLDRLGVKQSRAFKLSDGMGHHYSIDRLILRHDGITLINHKDYHGTIFCSEQIEQWTQMVGSQSWKFPNPLPELKQQIDQLQRCIPGVNVEGYLLFSTQCHFPKGKPQHVIQADSLPEHLLSSSHHQLSDELSRQWHELLNTDQKSPDKTRLEN